MLHCDTLKIFDMIKFHSGVFAMLVQIMFFFFLNVYFKKTS